MGKGIAQGAFVGGGILLIVDVGSDDMGDYVMGNEYTVFT